MQIRLTVVDPLGPHGSAGGRAASSDVLVTAPAGTALAAVASALAAALPGGEAPGTGQVVLYAGAHRLDTQRSTLGEPPLIDGAVLCLGAPGEPDPDTEPAGVPAQLHVVAGPDAGGVHLLHGGQIRLGRSADADVALDDPDVSRMHCAVTVTPDARVSVADLGSTNGTTLDGTRVGDRPVRFAPGALLRIGESALRLVPVQREAAARVATAPDGEGYVRLSGAAAPAAGLGDADEVAHARVADGGYAGDTDGASRAEGPRPSGAPSSDAGVTGGTARGSGAASAGWDTPAHGTGTDGGRGAAPAEPPQVPGQGGAPRIESHGTGPTAGFPRQAPAGGETHGGAASYGVFDPAGGGGGGGGPGGGGGGRGGGRGAGGGGARRRASPGAGAGRCAPHREPRHGSHGRLPPSGPRGGRDPRRGGVLRGVRPGGR
ncbi:hypothetical protein DMH12_31185, partial [Streptomyces sp. WAC 04229]|uniref:FHA domain-containing protein n=1 Tax=Streptomyces sp. WAC 04229 TaxID=2203206 RepID=UPI0010014A3F